jgi:hypothetical protein
LNSSVSSSAFICLLTALWVTPSCRAAAVTLKQLPVTENALSEVRLGEFFKSIFRGSQKESATDLSRALNKGHYKKE